MGKQAADATDWIDEAKKLSTRLLEPAAAQVDQSATIPPTHFDELAEQGFYGVALGSDNPLQTLSAVGEILVSGCLSTAFVWAQHHGTLLRLATSRNQALKERYLPGLQMGLVRAGVSGGGYAAPQRPLIQAHRTSDGYSIEGSAPFVTGWAFVDVLGVSAYDEKNDETVTFLAPASMDSGLSAMRLDLAAANASHTVAVDFDGYHVDETDVMHVARRVRSRQGSMSMLDRAIVRINGSLALGLARRSLTALDASGHGSQTMANKFTAVKNSLDRAVSDTSVDIHGARAQAGRFAVDASTYYTAVTGSRAVQRGEVAERTAREANFSLVCATTAEIRAQVLAGVLHQQQSQVLRSALSEQSSVDEGAVN
ncbi:acyl-CoA dehydrogenase [Rhodococcus sp. 06-156-3C]|nr:acyl-CoA dehydrogenase [Rhodococcus sp. 06-156-4C]OZD18888.1 acyl-CoA dehydrogenase [Rhodococcus sp. 06-156-3C]OZD22398.1 acyl-CoA dehydrogenase [Rhodococcus sp. 06-156-4a]OZD33982.1 acyl-CoA dehydrogenase [Rhodococcus sp. 06-156-3b]OZD38719.1 acyl-CoA dehydrogenase [Rhodococcus sp. 06-156-3]OZF57179.1 acyl-CoA dehydrogenase [Rhodococcus sp. 06-156-4]